VFRRLAEPVYFSPPASRAQRPDSVAGVRGLELANVGLIEYRRNSLVFRNILVPETFRVSSATRQRGSALTSKSVIWARWSTRQSSTLMHRPRRHHGQCGTLPLSMVDEDAEVLLAQQLTLRKTVEEKIDTPRPMTPGCLRRAERYCFSAGTDIVAGEEARAGRPYFGGATIFLAFAIASP
jgi:hypothetical protein